MFLFIFINNFAEICILVVNLILRRNFSSNKPSKPSCISIFKFYYSNKSIKLIIAIENILLLAQERLNNLFLVWVTFFITLYAKL